MLFPGDLKKVGGRGKKKTPKPLCKTYFFMCLENKASVLIYILVCLDLAFKNSYFILITTQF